MKTCIVTIIKNELDYLEEFIKYHIGIGIDHIFLFEDYGSLSHQDIASKYKDNVTVYSIDVVLNDHTRYTTQKYRNLAHGVYYNRALWFIKSNYDGIYDWCFATDIDEFITLRGIETTPENIRTYLSAYNDYDAIWLHWQNYNSNGHIYINPTIPRREYRRRTLRNVGHLAVVVFGLTVNSSTTLIGIKVSSFKTSTG